MFIVVIKETHLRKTKKNTVKETIKWLYSKAIPQIYGLSGLNSFDKSYCTQSILNKLRKIKKWRWKRKVDFNIFITNNILKDLRNRVSYIDL